MATQTTSPAPGALARSTSKGSLSLQSLLQKMKGQIEIALPKHMTAERMIRVGLTAVQKTPRLKECSPLSIVGCIVQASQLGLEPDGVLGQAYMVPYNNRKTGQKEAQLQIGYRGFITLARRSGEVSNVYSELVYQCDFFNVMLGTGKKLEHVPDYENETRGELDPETGQLIGLRGAYAVVIYKDGATDFEYMPLRELYRIRASSKAADDGPWVTHPAEMFRKCPIRKLAKRLPLSPEFMKAAAHDEHVDAGVMTATSELVDIDEPIFQDTQDHSLADKAQNTMSAIKGKYQKPQPNLAAEANPFQPPQQEAENLDAEPAPESQRGVATIQEQARVAQQKVLQKKSQGGTTKTSGKPQPEPDSGSIGDEQW